MIGTIARSSNSSIASAERPTGLVVPTSGSTSAVEESASARPSATEPLQALAEHVTARGRASRAQTEQLGRADPEHQPPHRPQAAEGELEPDREEQEDDAELGERLDRLGVGDGDIVEPGHLAGHRAEPGRADQQADRMKPMTGLIRNRAKAGMTIPAAPRMTSASLKPEVWKLPSPSCLYAGIGRHCQPWRGTKRDLCIVGGGPAGMMAGLLFARAGVQVTVLEKHGDFLRDFRGDTVHPSTLRIFSELGLLDRLLERPHDKVRELGGLIGGRRAARSPISPASTRAGTSSR